MGAISFSIDPRLLDLILEHLHTKFFVETGTFEGDSLAIAAAKFPKCYSVEASEFYFEQAKTRFAGQDNVRLFHSASPDFIKVHVAQLQAQPTFYWLDAHWCGGSNETAGFEAQCPLIDEIKAIGTLPEHSIIVIDDARIYQCPPPPPHRLSDWPDLQDVIDALEATSARHRAMIWNDVILFYPLAIKEPIFEFTRTTSEDLKKLARHAYKFRKARDKEKAAEEKAKAKLSDAGR